MTYPMAMYGADGATCLVRDEVEESAAREAGFDRHPSNINTSMLQTSAEVEAAVADAFEQCARICDSWPTGKEVAKELARAIRKSAKAGKKTVQEKETDQPPTE